ncbi:Hypothetical predicted protein [Mytilus galloprovincialis]|uniref:Uncharacterized protein n=1 Tax=Mytilus galloprovincialis TaxID=29158 RepID=A0A8B6C745_MYTGA|nr:Hypothetical predicted protein [Mytilus galloprovincialis]
MKNKLPASMLKQPDDQQQDKSWKNRMKASLKKCIEKMERGVEIATGYFRVLAIKMQTTKVNCRDILSNRRILQLESSSEDSDAGTIEEDVDVKGYKPGTSNRGIYRLESSVDAMNYRGDVDVREISKNHQQQSTGKIYRLEQFSGEQ